MKRILPFALCLALLFSAHGAAEDTVYYVNPDGGQFYHSEKQCPSISEAYWPRMATVTPDDLIGAPYSELSPCPFCVTPPAVGERPQISPWITRFDTASGIRIDQPGVYRTGGDLTPGLYTVTTDDQCDGLLITALNGGETVHEFSIRGEASYSFYLWDGMSVTLPGHAVLTPIVKRDAASYPPQTETILQGRRMLFYEMHPYVYEARAIEGEEGAIIFSRITEEGEQGHPTVIPLPAGAAVTFDTYLDGFNDPMPLRYFAAPGNLAYFVEFVNCVVTPVDPGNG